ncbi:MAG: hypothetical protein Q9196_003222 [Gyalolechia fulgens]
MRVPEEGAKDFQSGQKDGTGERGYWACIVCPNVRSGSYYETIAGDGEDHGAERGPDPFAVLGVDPTSAMLVVPGWLHRFFIRTVTAHVFHPSPARPARTTGPTVPTWSQVNEAYDKLRGLSDDDFMAARRYWADKGKRRGLVWNPNAALGSAEARQGSGPYLVRASFLDGRTGGNGGGRDGVGDQCTGLRTLAIDLTIHDVPLETGAPAGWMEPLYAFMDLGHLDDMKLRLRETTTADAVVDVEAQEAWRTLMFAGFHHETAAPTSNLFAVKPEPSNRNRQTRRTHDRRVHPLSVIPREG